MGEATKHHVGHGGKLGLDGMVELGMVVPVNGTPP